MIVDYSEAEDPKLQWALNRANFQSPGINSLGIGNTPQTLFYSPGAFNLDMSIAKEFRVGRGSNRILEFRGEAFNTFNHFNPNTALTYNFATGAQTNARFGVINGAAVQSRRIILAVRFKF
mgnify:CR=1 FL=1